MQAEAGSLVCPMLAGRPSSCCGSGQLSDKRERESEGEARLESVSHRSTLSP